MAARTLNSQGADFSLLAAAEGNLARLFSLDVIGAHVRLLVAIPMLFACESMLDPQLGGFARYLVRSGLLAGEALAVSSLLLAIAALGPLPRALISSPLQPGELGSTLLAFGGIALLSLAALFKGLLLTRVMP